MKKICFLISTILFTTAALYSQEVQFTGTLTARAGVALPYTENSGDFLLGETAFRGELSVYTEQTSLYLDGNFSYDALSNHENALDIVSPDGKFGLKLKEAWFDYASDFFALRVGRQISAWGKADGISVTDILCPKDNSSLFTGDYSESRLGIDAARASLKNEVYSFDFYFIPFFTPSALPSSITSQISETETPGLNIKNAEYAAKFSAYFSLLDFSLYGFYGFDDEPVASYALDATAPPIVSAEYKRLLMFGMDAAIPLGETVLRLEGAIFPNRHFATSAESQIASQMTGREPEQTEKCTQAKALLGLDWMPGSWTLTAQYYADILFGKPDFDKIERDRVSHLATLSVSKSLLGETLTLSLEGLLSLNDFDSAIQASADYALTDQLTLSAELYFFNEGKNEGTYGAFKDSSCLILGGKFSF